MSSNLPTSTVIFSKYGFTIFVSALMGFICATAMILFVVDERKHRGSWKACVNKFNILCELCLFGLTILHLGDCWSWFSSTYPSIHARALAGAFSDYFVNIGIALMGSTYVYYIYCRSNALLWGKKSGKYAKWGTFANISIWALFVSVATANVAIGGGISMVSVFLSLLNAFLLIGLDVFFTSIFTAHVKQTKIVLDQAVNDIDIIAYYGRFTTLGSFMSTVFYLLFTILYYAKVSPQISYVIYAFCRIANTWVGVFMMVMKVNLNRFNKKRVNERTVMSNIAAINSTKISKSTQNGTVTKRASREMEEAQAETFVAPIDSSPVSDTTSQSQSSIDTDDSLMSKD